MAKASVSIYMKVPTSANTSTTNGRRTISNAARRCASWKAKKMTTGQYQTNDVSQSSCDGNDTCDEVSDEDEQRAGIREATVRLV